MEYQLFAPNASEFISAGNDDFAYTFLKIGSLLPAENAESPMLCDPLFVPFPAMPFPSKRYPLKLRQDVNALSPINLTLSGIIKFPLNPVAKKQPAGIRVNSELKVSNPSNQLQL